MVDKGKQSKARYCGHLMSHSYQGCNEVKVVLQLPYYMEGMRALMELGAGLNDM